MKTASIVVIGNEVLSGKVTDINSTYITAELRKLGVDLRLIEIVPDDIDEIARVVSAASSRFDHVFTTGGVGPTHDDVTLEGIAKALGVKVKRSEEYAETLRKFYGESLNEHLLRMADLPEDSTLIWGDDLPVPVICARNVFIFPGEPGLMKKKFEVIRAQFRAEPYHLRRIFTTLDEGEIAGLLREAAEAHPEVQIGSYPVYSERVDYRVQVTIEAREEEKAQFVADYIKGRIPEETIVRLE